MYLGNIIPYKDQIRPPARGAEGVIVPEGIVKRKV